MERRNSWIPNDSDPMALTGTTGILPVALQTTEHTERQRLDRLGQADEFGAKALGLGFVVMSISSAAG